MNVPELLAQRRRQTEARLADLINELQSTGAEDIGGTSTCVYATGSVGRGEMAGASDLDIFIIRDNSGFPPLTNLNEIRLKARLIDATRKLKFPEFSDDGDYVKSYDVQNDFIKKLGTRTDDYHNVLTARLLLLLESRPILGKVAYEKAIENLLAVYWRDYGPNSGQFVPVFLTNDILRFWKTLCLNSSRGRPSLTSASVVYLTLLREVSPDVRGGFVTVSVVGVRVLAVTEWAAG